MDNWGQVKKIVASDRAGNDFFGYSVSINGNIVVVGAYQEDEDASGANTLGNAGSAYIFYKDQGGTDNWGQVKKIVASDRATNDYFGYSVSINGNIVVVGAYQEDEDASGANTTSNAGSAYIFYKDQGGVDNWGQAKKIVANDRGANDYFGYSVAISGNSIIAGAYLEDEDVYGTTTVLSAGSAYLFNKDAGGANNWGQEQKIVMDDVPAAQKYGNSVSIDGDYAVIGAPGVAFDASGTQPLKDAGAAYILKKINGNWVQIKKIVANDRAAIDNFGYSVSISGNTVVVGAYHEDENATGASTLISAGSVYIFYKDQGGVDNWGQVKKIVANDRAASDFFGYSVSINGNIVVVGAYQEDEDASGANTLSNAGSAYIFYKDQGGVDNWGQVKKIVASDRAANDNFGNTVSINGNIVVVGAYQEDEDASGANTLSNAGSAYIFYKDQGGVDNWGQVKKIVASDRAANDNFGNTVSINGNIVVVGAYQEDEDASGANTLSNAGSAYIFYKDQGGVDNWGQVKKIVASDRAANDYFGFSVAINGSLIVVGAPFEDHDAAGANPQTDAGSIYIFSKNQGGADKWGQIKKKVSIEREDNYNLGNSVAINGNTIVAGAYRHAVDDVANNYIFNAGAANIFRKDQGGVNNWGEADKKVASDRGYNDYFGNSVAISGNDIVVGAPYEDDDIEETNNIADAGSAYFFNSCSAHTLPSTFAAAIGAQVWFESRDIKNVDCNLIATLSELPNDGTPIYTTNVSAKVWIESTQPGNFVKRHYEITPVHTVNGYNVTVTLYFTQQEFNDFNAVNASKLPTGPSDAAGKANLRIEKKSGISSDGSGLPNTYTGAAETIDPNDAFIVWNSSLSRWEVSFQVTSFSGFFVKTQLFALPVQWLSINGYLNNQKQTILNWKVQEQNISDYTIEKSEDGRSFHSIGIVAGKGDGTNSYAYLDVNPVSGTVFYRIKQKDIESRTSYSTIIKISTDSKAKLQAFPTFAHEGFTVVSPILQTAVLYDMNGRTLKQIALQAGSNYVNISNLAAGMYLLKASHGDVIKIEKQ